MKTVQNPTQYFFEQANNPPTEYLDKINEFVQKLINYKQCILCKNDYNMKDRLPRILIHCGHTVCQSCTMKGQIFYKYSPRNRRVRCPLCLKLIKQIDSIERLPINHTIFTRIAEEINNKSKQHGGTDILKPQEHLFNLFQQQSIQAQKVKEQNEQLYCGVISFQRQLKIDPDTGLEFCEYHSDRVKHFFCMLHKLACCRACVEMLHQKTVRNIIHKIGQECAIVDLYEIEDPQDFLKQAFAQEGESNSSNQDNEVINVNRQCKSKWILIELLIILDNNKEQKINFDDEDDDFEDEEDEEDRASLNSV